ncbi:HAMP domain-containing sensor histidine kinase [Metaclostridioides mangenotii]|uniref:sensor histidine kinase n=1 Tax=Metaclostridioides mangenotii TaxID=1540 RepID=UPI0028EABDBF|nr:HAMP domain-containing sensor histidine kinase [Clostridioides mangenotii]
MICLVIAALILIVVSICQFFYIRNMKNRLKEISDTLDEIKQGNLDLRLYATENDVTSDLVYKINDIVIHNKNKLSDLKRAEKSYKELVTSLSHDIRTPLASIIGYLDVLENETVNLEEQRQFIKTSKNKALSLSEYIQTLFDWLKLESGEWVYSFEKENICELTRIILADWIIKLEKNNMLFQFVIPDENVYLLMDKNVYGRIVNNILTNIIKHSKADCLSFSLSFDDYKIMIKFEDNGIGISESDLPHIFDRLYKCDNARTENSNGLGLAIVKELISVLDGKIYVESQLNVGTTFTIVFHYKHK